MHLTFTPPKNWPNAASEARVDTLADKAQHVGNSMHSSEARELVYQAVDMLRRAYGVEMEARLALWRSQGYSL